MNRLTRTENPEKLNIPDRAMGRRQLLHGALGMLTGGVLAACTNSGLDQMPSSSKTATDSMPIPEQAPFNHGQFPEIGFQNRLLVVAGLAELTDQRLAARPLVTVDGTGEIIDVAVVEGGLRGTWTVNALGKSALRALYLQPNYVDPRSTEGKDAFDVPSYVHTKWPLQAVTHEGNMTVRAAGQRPGPTFLESAASGTFGLLDAVANRGLYGFIIPEDVDYSDLRQDRVELPVS